MLVVCRKLGITIPIVPGIMPITNLAQIDFTRDGRYVLPVRAGSRDKVPGIVHDSSGSGQTLFVDSGQHLLAQPLRAGDVAQAGVQHVLDRRIAARERVADDDEVGFVRQVAFGVAIHHGDLAFREKRGHGRIHRLV